MNSSEPFVYYGTSDFSAAILRGLVEADFTPSLVVSTAPQPAGRGLQTWPTPVIGLARQLRLSTLEVKTLKSSEVFERLAAQPAVWAVLAAFGKIIPSNILNLYPKSIVNIHPSLLPAWRGPAPIQYALRDGAPETGVSMIILDSKVDHGPVLAQVSEPITTTDDAVTLSTRLAQLAVTLLIKTLPSYLAGVLKPVEQDHAQATFTAMVQREDGRADFGRAALELDRQRRALTPWPGLWTTWQGKRLKLIATGVYEHTLGQPGSVTEQNGGVYIACGQGSLEVHSLQLEGGRAVQTMEFIRGHRMFVSVRLPS